MAEAAKRDQSWSSKGPEARTILAVLRDGTLNPFTATPGTVLEIFPDYIKFKKNSFDSGVRFLCNLVKNELQKSDSEKYQRLAEAAKKKKKPKKKRKASASPSSASPSSSRSSPASEASQLSPSAPASPAARSAARATAPSQAHRSASASSVRFSTSNTTASGSQQRQQSTSRAAPSQAHRSTFASGTPSSAQSNSSRRPPPAAMGDHMFGPNRVDDAALDYLSDVFLSYVSRTGPGLAPEIIDSVHEAYIGAWGPLFYVYFIWNDRSGAKKAAFFMETPPGNRKLHIRINSNDMSITVSTDCPSYILDSRELFENTQAAQQSNVAAYVSAVLNTCLNSANGLSSACTIKIRGLRNVKAAAERKGKIRYTSEFVASNAYDRRFEGLEMMYVELSEEDPGFYDESVGSLSSPDSSLGSGGPGHFPTVIGGGRGRDRGQASHHRSGQSRRNQSSRHSGSGGRQRSNDNASAQDMSVVEETAAAPNAEEINRELQRQNELLQARIDSIEKNVEKMVLDSQKKVASLLKSTVSEALKSNRSNANQRIHNEELIAGLRGATQRHAPEPAAAPAPAPFATNHYFPATQHPAAAPAPAPGQVFHDFTPARPSSPYLNFTPVASAQNPTPGATNRAAGFHPNSPVADASQIAIQESAPNEDAKLPAQSTPFQAHAGAPVAPNNSSAADAAQMPPPPRQAASAGTGRVAEATDTSSLASSDVESVTHKARRRSARKIIPTIKVVTNGDSGRSVSSAKSSRSSKRTRSESGATRTRSSQRHDVAQKSPHGALPPNSDNPDINFYNNSAVSKNNIIENDEDL